MEKYDETIRELFICKCESVEHQLIFTYDEYWNEVFVNVHLVPYKSIWKRICASIKYIFGYKSRQFEEFIFKKSDSDKLQKIIDHLCADINSKNIK